MNGTPNLKNKQIGSYLFEEIIGFGPYSTVWKGIHKELKKEVAIKVIPKIFLNNKEKITRFHREINFLKGLNHPLIIKLYFVTEDDDFHYLVMEYASNGDLRSHINSNGAIAEILVRRYFLQLLEVIYYLHKEKKIVHRDIKSENILFDKYFNIRLVDFGLSKSFIDEEPSYNSICGSPYYVSPEILKGEKYSTPTDIWSLGIVLYSMVNGSLPFLDSKNEPSNELILEGELKFIKKFSIDLQNLILKMLEKSSLNRITLDNIIIHPWISENSFLIIHKYINLIEINKIDEEILNKLINLNLISKDLPLIYLLNDFNEHSSIYKMLLSESITNKLQFLPNPRSILKQTEIQIIKKSINNTHSESKINLNKNNKISSQRSSSTNSLQIIVDKNLF